VESVSPQGAQIGFEAPVDGLLNLPSFFTAPAYAACYPARRLRDILGSKFIMLDNFAVDEFPAASKPDLQRFESNLAHDSGYRLVRTVDYVPTFLGVSFPIAGSPHDWRYPSHAVTIYQRVASVSDPPSACLLAVSAAGS
jgi:hypothetical protein